MNIYIEALYMYIYNVYSVKLNNEVTIRRIIVWIQPSNINQDSSKTSMYPFLQTLKEQNSKWVPNNHQSIYCLCNWRPWCLLFDERVPQNLPSRERTYPYQGTSEDDFHFPQVGICLRSLKCITKTSFQSPRIQSFTRLQTFSNGPDDASPGWWYWLQQVNETFLGKR